MPRRIIGGAFISLDGVVQAHQVDTLFAGDFDLLPAGGTLMATYEPAGALKTGSFETQKPSEFSASWRNPTHVNRLTNSSAFSATSRQPASIVSECPRPGILTISVTALLRFCFL